MNKLLVSDTLSLNDGVYHLNIKTTKLDISITGDVTIYLINEEVNNLNIFLLDNSNLTIYIFNNLKLSDKEVNIYQNNNTKLFFNEAFTNVLDHNLVINNYLKKDNNISNINIRNISNKNTSKIIVNVDISKNTINNVALEDLKGINNGGLIHIEPNIICDTHEVIANHLTTIGCLDEDSVNYLMMKGISKSIAEHILLDSFIYSNMDDYIKKIRGGD